jgi:hypothetical protein
MAGKPPLDREDKVPGPGTYNRDKIVNVVKSKASIVFGNE